MAKKDFPKSYQPAQYESDIYRLWEEQAAFTPDNAAKESFSIVVPPPNANASLHIGFGLTMAIQDTIVRFQRMMGKSGLFVPGADHAGFETWVVFEKKLQEEGKSRFDFSRDELYRQVWDFVAANRKNFEKQFRQLGASVNWDRFTFTLDDKVVKQAYATFKQLWQEGLIYRGERVVNYCTYHDTGFADIEVEHRLTDSHLWYINYPLTEGQGALTVATTRPETIFGDVAVAVNPRDKRYKKYIGKSVRLPLVNKVIPVIADEVVDMQFGTGAVKVTPAHDPTDFEIGQRHNLPTISVIGTDGHLTAESPEAVRGLGVDEAREKTVEMLKEQGSLEKTEPHRHSVGHCYKCGTVIQPLLREQWFVKMKPLAEPAIKALQQNQIKFHPGSKRQQLIQYLENLRDWNISRQIAWGIAIPAFQNEQNPDDWIFDERTEQPQIEANGKTYRRDPEVFDTWFSSSSWPYVTLDFPDGRDFQHYYPLSLMETGGEILYPWVSRMLMFGLYNTGQVPFKEVYIHGHVMAEDGSKMSKSLGNVVNAENEIADFGADALRMGLIAGRVAGVNRPYDRRRVEEARNLANKLWNVCRYSAELIAQHESADSALASSIADQYILNKLSITTEKITKHLKSYKLGEAYEQLYHFIWDDLADWYVEASKVLPSPAILKQVIEQTLKLAHPLAPFVSEAIWQQLGWQSGLLAKQSWPEKLPADKAAAGRFEDLQNLVRQIRQIIAELKLNKPRVVYTQNPLIEQNQQLILALSGAGEIVAGKGGQGLQLNSRAGQVWLDLSAEQLAAYKNRLTDRLKAAEAVIKSLEQRLGNKAYLAKAPKQLVEESKESLAGHSELVKQLKQSLSKL